MEDSATIRAKLVFLEEVETRTSSVGLVMVSMARWTGERSELISHFNSPQLPRPYWQEGNMDGWRPKHLGNLFFSWSSWSKKGPRLRRIQNLIYRRTGVVPKFVLLEIVCLLKQGMLVVGGVNANGEFLSSTEVYFASARKWTKRGQLPRHWSWYILIIMMAITWLLPEARN